MRRWKMNPFSPEYLFNPLHELKFYADSNNCWSILEYFRNHENFSRLSGKSFNHFRIFWIFTEKRQTQLLVYVKQNSENLHRYGN